MKKCWEIYENAISFEGAGIDEHLLGLMIEICAAVTIWLLINHRHMMQREQKDYLLISKTWNSKKHAYLIML